jgi:hypothetical protein
MMGLHHVVMALQFWALSRALDPKSFKYTR